MKFVKKLRERKMPRLNIILAEFLQETPEVLPKEVYKVVVKVQRSKRIPAQ